MTCAVVYLRYHYFVDALFAIVLVKAPCLLHCCGANIFPLWQVGLKMGRLNMSDQQAMLLCI